MSLFSCLKWPEMRPVTLKLIERMHTGHALRQFSIPVVDFVSVFAPGAAAAEMEKVAERGDIHFTAEGEGGGVFALNKGARATFDLPARSEVRTLRS
jgi:hypothetical protein